jgi:hypothetical protein
MYLASLLMGDMSRQGSGTEGYYEHRFTFPAGTYSITVALSNSNQSGAANIVFLGATPDAYYGWGWNAPFYAPWYDQPDHPYVGLCQILLSGMYFTQLVYRIEHWLPEQSAGLKVLKAAEEQTLVLYEKDSGTIRHQFGETALEGGALLSEEALEHAARQSAERLKLPQELDALYINAGKDSVFRDKSAYYRVDPKSKEIVHTGKIKRPLSN